MILAPGEPAAGPWRVRPLTRLVERLRAAAGPPGGRPWVLAVDGRSGAGKSTLAGRIAASVPGAVVVHTDDVAWHESFFGWAGLLSGGVLAPARRGEPVAYRPPAWEARGRAGAITVPAGCPLLIVEGVGAGRRELTELTDTVVWIQSDLAEAERRGVARDGGTAEAAAFWHEWMAEELPFQAAQRPWERAAAVVSGTPHLPHDPATEVVVAGSPHGPQHVDLAARRERVETVPAQPADREQAP